MLFSHFARENFSKENDLFFLSGIGTVVVSAVSVVIMADRKDGVVGKSGVGGGDVGRGGEGVG